MASGSHHSEHKLGETTPPEPTMNPLITTVLTAVGAMLGK
jgi:hypothetical protein